jgi:Chaperone of endosialidase
MTSRVSPRLILGVLILVASRRPVHALTLPDEGSCATTGGTPCLFIHQTNTGSGLSISSDGVGIVVVGGNGNAVTASTISGYAAVSGTSSGNSNGVAGQNSAGGNGVYGYNASSGSGVYGSSVSGYGVYGISGGAWPNAGVFGKSNTANGTAVAGIATAANATAVVGIASFTNSFGAFFQGTSVGAQGFSGTATNGIGISGVSSGTGGHAVDGICNGSCAVGGQGYAGYFTGNVYVTGTVTQGSDARLKKDVADAPYGLEQLLQLRPVTYRWKQEGTDGERQIGLIAQDVQKLLPELVHRNATSGMLSLNYLGLQPVLIKAVQEQEKTIQWQEKALRGLEARIALLEHGRAPVMSSFSFGNLGTGIALGLLPVGLIAASRRRKRPECE